MRRRTVFYSTAMPVGNRELREYRYAIADSSIGKQSDVEYPSSAFYLFYVIWLLLRFDCDF